MLPYLIICRKMNLELFLMSPSGQNFMSVECLPEALSVAAITVEAKVLKGSIWRLSTKLIIAIGCTNLQSIPPCQNVIGPR